MDFNHEMQLEFFGYKAQVGLINHPLLTSSGKKIERLDIINKKMFYISESRKP